MSRRAAQKLTKKLIDGIGPGKKGGTWHGDAELPGLYLVSYPSGAKIFLVRFLAARRRRAVVVGRYGVLTLSSARLKAREHLSSATLGGDPATARDKARGTPTFSAWADTYLSRVRLEKKSPGTMRSSWASEAKRRRPSGSGGVPSPWTRSPPRTSPPSGTA